MRSHSGAFRIVRDEPASFALSLTRVISVIGVILCWTPFWIAGSVEIEILGLLGLLKVMMPGY